jgi:hypothetical protein
MTSSSRFVTPVGFERVAGKIVCDGEWRRFIFRRREVGPLHRLAERGCVSIERADGKGRAFAVTIHGREAASAYGRQRSAAGGSAVALDWSVVNPVLEVLYDAYTQAGAPEHGVEASRCYACLSIVAASLPRLFRVDGACDVQDGTGARPGSVA